MTKCGYRHRKTDGRWLLDACLRLQLRAEISGGSRKTVEPFGDVIFRIALAFATIMLEAAQQPRREPVQDCRRSASRAPRPGVH
jgi:hypothetical protein